MSIIANFALGLSLLSWIGIGLAVISLGLSIYQMISAKGPGEPPVPKPNAVDNVPTAEQGKPIPMLFGTRIIGSPNVVWWGYPRNTKIQMTPDQIKYEQNKKPK